MAYMRMHLEAVWETSPKMRNMFMFMVLVARQTWQAEVEREVEQVERQQDGKAPRRV
jgi:hypothetical protein